MELMLMNDPHHSSWSPYSKWVCLCWQYYEEELFVLVLTRWLHHLTITV